MLKLKREKKFRELYNLYYPFVLNVIIKKTDTREDAEDICHEVFVTFYNKFEEIENPKSWLYSAVKFAFSNYYRRKSNVQKGDSSIDDVLNDSSLQFTNGFKDTRIILQEVINSDEVYEDEKERILFQLLAVNSFSKKQAARQLGYTRSQVDYKYSKISKRIVEILKRKGISDIDELL